MIRILVLAALLLGANAQAAGTRLDPKAPQGAVSGRIEFPGNGVAPAMRICVVAAGGGASRCIDSPQGRTLYRVDGLVDGDYQVVARVDAAETPVAGHVEQAVCALAPCTPRLQTVAVTGGKEVATAHLNGFYARRDDFPVVPATE